MDRNSQASLSPSEIASLRGVGRDSKRQIPGGHRQVLLSMHLVVAEGEDLRLTDVGNSRLLRAEGEQSRQRRQPHGSA